MGNYKPTAAFLALKYDLDVERERLVTEFHMLRQLVIVYRAGLELIGMDDGRDRTQAIVRVVLNAGEMIRGSMDDTRQHGFELTCGHEHRPKRIVIDGTLLIELCEACHAEFQRWVIPWIEKISEEAKQRE